MFTLRNSLSQFVTFKSKKFKINLAFNAVLDCFKISSEQELSDNAKIELSLKLLCKQAKKLNMSDKAKLYCLIFKKLINTNIRKGSGNDNRPTFDFEYDADLIYSSFVQAYNIDLIDMRNKLDWRKFYSLFLGLPESTKMREVMSIRARHIPFPTKNNQDEIRSLNELKAYWFLPCDVEENYQTELNNLFNGLKNLAKKT